jgi:hypothetical protein
MATLTLPGGAPLGPEERLVRSDEIAVSIILFFLKIKVAVTNSRVVGEWPNTFLGLIPVGSNSVTYPLTNVASVAVSSKVSVGSLVLGVILCLIGLQGSGGVFLLIVGILFLLNAFPASFVITNNAGQKIGHRMAVFEKGKAQALANEINTLIVNLKR